MFDHALVFLVLVVRDDDEPAPVRPHPLVDVKGYVQPFRAVGPAALAHEPDRLVLGNIQREPDDLLVDLPKDGLVTRRALATNSLTLHDLNPILRPFELKLCAVDAMAGRGQHQANAWPGDLPKLLQADQEEFPALRLAAFAQHRNPSAELTSLGCSSNTFVRLPHAGGPAHLFHTSSHRHVETTAERPPRFRADGRSRRR